MFTNISKIKREQLLSHLEEIRLHILQNAPNAELESWISEISAELKGKKYGLVYEQHRENIQDLLLTYLPILSEQKDFSIRKGNQIHSIIEGDNLPALELLKKTHKGRVDLIYIDPPYNTLNDSFTYSDTRVDKNDTFRHSKWLSFMEPRLSLARKLLSKEGAIFISIDDNEVGALRMLCDEIFGPSNFVANIIWEKKFSPQNDAKWLSDTHDHILLYAKDKDNWKPNLLPRTEDMNNRYKNPDNDLRGPWTSGDLSVKTYSAETDYPIVTPSERIVNPPNGYCWRVSKSKLNEMIKDNRIWFGPKGNNVPRIKRFLSEVQQGAVSRTIWYRTEVGDTQEGTQVLKAVFENKGVFTNPKPVRLIKRILQLASKPNSIVLDFFAGSGTTGQAVLEMNQEDNGQRSFILVTNNENNICREVTYERIKRVIDKNSYDASLLYYKLDYIDINNKVYYEYADELLHHAKEMIQLQYGVDLSSDNRFVFIYNDDEMEVFKSNIHQSSMNIAKVFISYDVLPDPQFEQSLERKGIEITRIPEYYYTDRG